MVRLGLPRVPEGLSSSNQLLDRQSSNSWQQVKHLFASPQDVEESATCRLALFHVVVKLGSVIDGRTLPGLIFEASSPSTWLSGWQLIDF